MTLRSLVLSLTACFAVGCTPSSRAPETSPAAAPGAASDKSKSGASSDMKVGLVLDKGGKDDKSFNSAAFRGATQAVQDFHIALKDVECPDDAAFEPALRTFAERGYPLIIAIGFAQIDAVKKVAPQFPQTHFAIVDGVVDGGNVASLMFSEHEGSFLVGYLAALASKTGKVGFIGGMDVPLIRRFQMGYEAGVKAANANASVLVNYVGVNSSAWANPSRGKELALGQIARDADVIFHAAGASGLGVFDAVEEKQKFAIGVDSNQNAMKPGRVLTSMLKRVDTAVYEIIKEQSESRFRAGTRYFGLADKGIDYAVDEHNQNLIVLYRERLEKVRTDIANGAIQVPDYYLLSKSKSK
ncbi:MAG: BMP family ABC transporter substrate-binding protein [Bdellovibrionaceae bacterium]|nr:BMP family ABC transporter substrate-binding protein [Pseudobdellovibrionaceae bacterium]